MFRAAMFRAALAATVALGAITVARAHFVFVVPDLKDPAKAVVVFSEDLEPDEHVTADKMATLKLTCRDAAGKDTAVEHKAGKHELTAALPGSGPRVVFGSLNYGVMQKGDAKPYLLAYHPKALVGAVPADKQVLGAKAVPAEVIPVVTGGEVRFKFLQAGKPVAAVCHAPWLLIDAGLVKDRKVTSWPSVRTDLTNAGATVVDESAVIDRGIITSRKPEDLHDFVRAIASQLN